MAGKLSKDGRAFASGLVWNYISLVFMAGSGLCFSLLIGIFYDAEALGYFNTFYALYIALAQLAAFGCQNAVTKKVSEKPDDTGAAKSVLLSAFVIIFVVSAVLQLVSRIGFFVAGKVTGGSYLREIELDAMLFGILVFALNKIILGYFNGLSRMKEFAVFQSLRYIFIAGFIVLFSVLRQPREYLILSFLCAEGLLSVCELPSIIKSGFNNVAISKPLIRELFVFGYKILPGNVVLELNTKADVLCLSLLTRNERTVGIYSFAVLFAEGFYQLFVVVRRSLNPKITLAHVEGRLALFYADVRKKMRRFGYMAGLICAIIITFVFRLGCVFLKDPSYREGTAALVIIMAAIIINLESIVWGNLLSQTGFPAQEARVNLATILSNVVMNMIFISLFGMIGAAIGTAISYFVFALTQRLFIKRSEVLR